MEKSSGPGSQYSFVQKERQKRSKQLLLISIAFLSLILITLTYSVVSSLISKGKTNDTVDKVFKDDQQEQAKKENEQKVTAYKAASIPYDDPQGRFSIIFVTPFVSDRVAVVFNTNKDYDKVKIEADAIINEAKKKVPIQSVSYINNSSK